MTVRTVATRGSGGAPRAVRIEYASFEARLVAATLDLLVLVILAALCVLVGSLIVLVSSDFERVDPSDAAINAFWICIGAIAPLVLLYLFVSFAWKGQTIGDAVMQLMVIRSDGRPLGILGSLARVVGLLSYLVIVLAGIIAAVFFQDSTIIAGIAIGIAIFLVLLGILWAAFDGRRRTLHDRLAGTIVVRIR
jgi:uncharacterized RDD family membrane protein YckC